MRLFLILIGLWFILSGHFSVLPVVPGLIFITIGFFLYKKAKKDAGFKEIFAINSLKLFLYTLYLAKEIIISNFRVARTIIKNDLSPQVFKIKNTFKTNYGITIFANSVTLPPETIILRADENEFLIHSLTIESMNESLDGTMYRKVLQLEEDLLKNIKE
ncbi:MAG: Na+/H+ antiporter subunit E [Alphaproteobacteria bacterium]|nr:Na+/H+ antiporter subunit E [Alphaproteobacteria bacterium]